MTFRDIRAALTALLLGLGDGCKVVKGDVREPVVRPAYKLDVLPGESGAACDGARERAAEIDIWFYPKNKDRPLDECTAAAERLTSALDGGFSAGGVWLTPDDALTIDLSDGVLVCQLTVTWYEAAAETGEVMETLVYDGEELS